MPRKPARDLRVLRSCTDLQASSKFQILYVRRTANVNYRAVCSTSYPYLVPTTFLIAFIAIILDYNIAWNVCDNLKTRLTVICCLLKEKDEQIHRPLILSSIRQRERWYSRMSKIEVQKLFKLSLPLVRVSLQKDLINDQPFPKDVHGTVRRRDEVSEKQWDDGVPSEERPSMQTPRMNMSLLIQTSSQR